MYRGRYINLDRNTTRRAAIEENLRQAGVADRYQRFSAIDGREATKSRQTSLAPGYLGNWLSHEQVVAEHQDQDEHLHVLEDDALLPPETAGTLFDGILARADAEIPDWDLLFTDVAPAVDTRAMLALSEFALLYPQTRRIGLVDLSSMDFAGTASLFVNRRSIAKYLQVILGKWDQGHPIDLYLRQQVHGGQLRAYVTSPFLTTVSSASGQSDIGGPHDFSHALIDLYRRSFYLHANLAELNTRASELIRGARVPLLGNIFIQVHYGAMSDRWREF